MSDEEYLTLAEIARRLLLTSPTIGNWRSRYNEFPKPILLKGKRELWTITQIEQFMVSSGLDGRDRQYRQTQLQKPDSYTEAANLVELMRPICRPEDSVIYLLIKAWDLKSTKPSKSTTKLIEKINEIRIISTFSRNVLKIINIADPQILRTIDKHIETIIKNGILQENFLINLKEIWAETGRDRAATTSPENLGKLIAMFSNANYVLDMCAGVGTALAHFPISSKIVAQDLNQEAAGFLYLVFEIQKQNIEIYAENSLETLHREWLNSFDCVIAVPPSRGHDIRIVDFSNDPRWMKFDKYQLKSQEAWILNAIAYIKFDGIAIVGVPTKWITSASSENIRLKLIGLGHVRASITLGPGYFNDNRTGMTLLILSSANKPNEIIRLIDARKLSKEADFVKIINIATHEFKVLESTTPDIDEFCKFVSPEELLGVNAPLDKVIYEASTPVRLSSDPRNAKQKISKNLIDFARHFETIASELRTIAQLGETIEIGPTNLTKRLKEVAELEIFSFDSDYVLSTSDIENHDIFLPLAIDNKNKKLQIVCESLHLIEEGTKKTGTSFYESVLKANTDYCRIRVNRPSTISAKLIAIYLDMPAVCDLLSNVSDYSSQQNMSIQIIENLLIHIPPIDVQNKIEKFYDRVDEIAFNLFYDDFDFETTYKDFVNSVANLIQNGKS